MKNFKVNDWVTNTEGFIFQYKEEFKEANDFTLWQPKEGEWVIIHPIHPTMNKPISFTVRQYFKNDPYWKLHIEKCEPFQGTLPSFTGDKQ